MPATFRKLIRGVDGEFLRARQEFGLRDFVRQTYLVPSVNFVIFWCIDAVR